MNCGKFLKLKNMTKITKESELEEKSNGVLADISSWVATTEKLPAIDESDNWNKEHKISKDVLTYSKEWGMRFGRYFYSAEFWTINGVTSSNEVQVDYWQEVKPPCY
jgi:hypothetical protein